MSWWIAGAAAVGAIADRKKPLRGAAMGAGLMATGGAAAGAMGGGAAAAGTGAAAGGATAAGTGAAGGGLLGGTAAAGTAAPAATAAPSTGLLSTFGQYKPAFDAAATGVQMSGLLDQQPEQSAPAPAPMTQGGPETLATIAAQGAPATVQAGMQERARRRAMLRGGV